MYESPINRIMQDLGTFLTEQEDGRLLCEVKTAIGYQIDKNELIMALNYDRDQYNKGYQDGIKDGFLIDKENPTNGDVIMAMFPNEEFIKGTTLDHISNLKFVMWRGNEVFCGLDWWNAPYERGNING